MGQTAKRRRLYNEQSGLCAYCFNQMTMRLGQDNTCTIDHVIPKSKGGDHGLVNSVAACAQCNHSKSDYSLVRFLWARKGRATSGGRTCY